MPSARTWHRRPAVDPSLHQQKIYLRDLLIAKKLAIPRPKLFSATTPTRWPRCRTSLASIVLKIPDGSVSRGVSKVDAQALKQAAETLFQQSALLLAQEYIYTEFDWRIGVLNREPPSLPASTSCRAGTGRSTTTRPRARARTGGFATLPIRQAPSDVVKLATRAAELLRLTIGFTASTSEEVGDRVVVIGSTTIRRSMPVSDEYLGGSLPPSWTSSCAAWSGAASAMRD